MDALSDALTGMGYTIAGDAMRADEALAVLEEGQTDLAILVEEPNKLLITDSVFVKDDLIFRRVAVEDIQYVQSYRNYIELNVGQGGKHVLRSTRNNSLLASRDWACPALLAKILPKVYGGTHGVDIIAFYPSLAPATPPQKKSRTCLNFRYGPGVQYPTDY